jgi:hypothetical protein
MFRRIWVLRVIALALVAMVPARTEADLIGTGDGGLIPDQFLGEFTSVIHFDVHEQIHDVKVTLNNLVHSYSGDVVIWIEGPDGSTVDLINRLGKPDEGFWGRDAAFGGDYAFMDSFPNDLWETPGDPVPSGDYFPTTAEGVATSLQAEFQGSSSLGDWTLHIRDESVRETGSLGTQVGSSWENGWTLEIQAVPEPTSWALFGFGGVFLIAYRWSRYRKTG